MCDKFKGCIAKAPCPVHNKYPWFRVPEMGPLSPHRRLSFPEQQYVRELAKDPPQFNKEEAFHDTW